MRKIFKRILSASIAVVMTMGVAMMGEFADFVSVKASATKITNYSQGDIIEFGWYPQSEVKDEAIISALNADTSEWISYNYYSGTGDTSDGKMTASDYMRYKDVIYGDDKYRGVVFDSFRPYRTGHISSSLYAYQGENYTYQDNNGYSFNNVYWFKYEPIEWRVLDPNTGMVIAETILDSQAYNNYCLYANDEFYGDSSKTYYANNYAESSIREWLNDDFYNTAFSTAQQNIIEYTTLDNSAFSDSYSAYDSATTTDKIYLLAYDDALTTSYGFSSRDDDYNYNRRAKGSDYAKCQGLHVLTSYYSENSYWILRSANNLSHYICSVSFDGNVFSVGGMFHSGDTSYGIRPVLNFKQSSKIIQSNVKYIGELANSTHSHNYTSEITLSATHLTEGIESFTCECGDFYTETIEKTPTHNHKSVVTAPTCTEKGYTTYTCECGDTYVADYVNETGHSHTSEITTPATHLKEGVETFTCVCGDSYTKPVAKIEVHNHKATVTAPTCTEKGYTTYTCECGDTYVADYVNETGHSHTTEITTPATHTSTGVMTYTCHCGDTYTEVIDKIATHNYLSVVTEPTCTEKGYTTYTCECGDTYVADYVDATGHGEGDKQGNCKNCGEHICDHDCHKTGITGFFWKIVCFFNKLFGSNKFCECGATHY